MEEAAIAQPFTETDRERLRNLLELAESSPFPGERDNALAAARRLAERYDMSLEEAASRQPDRQRAPGRHSAMDGEFVSPFVYRPDRKTADRWQRTSLDPAAQEAEKKRWEEAVSAARQRGLDGGGKSETERFGTRRPNSRSRRNPIAHATVLLKETSLPFEEIADITGLDIYDVIAMKLKLRAAA
ncbi:MAG: DUF2786 domain-containing protein [Rhodospirillales bacterium]|nr:DUF2786 domain-containing protein [Rhodospirillales bacterium]